MEDAVARLERLKALKQAAELVGDKEEEPEPARPTLKFRNYQVHDKKIEHEQVGDPCSRFHLGSSSILKWAGCQLGLHAWFHRT